MLKVFANNIAMTRGDTVRLALTLRNADGSEYQLQEGDVVYLTVKNQDEIIISKDITGGIIIYPEDTAYLEYGEYDYDIEVKLSNGDVNTVIIAKLRITEEVRS